VSSAAGPPPNGEPIDATIAAYLADIAALASKDASWCLRIPQDMQVASEPAKFRDWCLFTLASNTKNAALCGRIPIRPSERDARLSLHANCKRQANSPYPSTLRYEPELPDDDNLTRVLIHKLDYPIPRAADLPLESIAAAYGLFLNELENHFDAPHTAARRRFVERVQRLPNFNSKGEAISP
jgi:hypothetical protein